jgi:hypothetical protein
MAAFMHGNQYTWYFCVYFGVMSYNNNKIFIYTDKKDRSVNYIDCLVSIGDPPCITSIYTVQ